jgi:hypothetical protein
MIIILSLPNKSIVGKQTSTSFCIQWNRFDCFDPAFFVCLGNVMLCGIFANPQNN